MLSCSMYNIVKIEEPLIQVFFINLFRKYKMKILILLILHIPILIFLVIVFY